MNNALKDLLSFHLAGSIAPENGSPSPASGSWPALLRRYRDLSLIRHDWPALLPNQNSDRSIQSLSHRIQSFLEREAPMGPDGDRLRRHLLRLEKEIRTLLLHGQKGSLEQLWQIAAANLAARPHLTDDARKSLDTDLQRARPAIAVEDELIGCGGDTASLVVRHLWRESGQARNNRIREQLRELRFRLTNLLKHDELRSGAACQPEALRAAFGGRFDHLIDFNVMSRSLLAGRPPEPMPVTRRERIQWALSVLQTERFFDEAQHETGFRFEFPSCTEALAEFKRRLPNMVALVKAIRTATLELENRFRSDTHDALFQRFDARSLTADDIQWFPSCLVSLQDRDCDAANLAALIEILSSDLPIKVLFQTAALFQAGCAGAGTPGTAWRSHLAAMALNLNHPFVLQTTSSNLCRMTAPIAQGLARPGPALFSVFSPEEASFPGIPPYLVSAAALESRACPTFVFDPGKGASSEARFRLEGNPAPDRAWSAHAFTYEDETMRTATETLPFTVVDFLALDPVFAGAFRPISTCQWNECMVPVADHIEAGDTTKLASVPFLLMVDSNDQLHRVAVQSTAIRLARRCQSFWRSLQELAEINNSHIQRAVEAEKRVWKAEPKRLIEGMHDPVNRPSGPTSNKPASARVTHPTPDKHQPECAPADLRDEARIETARCSSCNECTNRNNRMFQYNENKQAYIADVRAGTYRQLIDAAEACKLAIIHPGKPWNPDEPDLDDLLRRAEPFRQADPGRRELTTAC